jgi:hypothetical protein
MTEEWRQDLIEQGDRLQIQSSLRSLAHLHLAQKWSLIHYSFGLSITLLSALVGASFFTETTEYENVVKLFTLIITIASAINTYLKPGEKKGHHEIAHKNYIGLSYDSELLSKIEAKRRMNSVPEYQKELGEKLSNLMERMKKIQLDSPLLSPKLLEKPTQTYLKSQAASVNEV